MQYDTVPIDHIVMAVFFTWNKSHYYLTGRAKTICQLTEN